MPDKQWSSPPAFALDGGKKYSATIKTNLGEMTADLTCSSDDVLAHGFAPSRCASISYESNALSLVHRSSRAVLSFCPDALIISMT